MFCPAACSSDDSFDNKLLCPIPLNVHYHDAIFNPLPFVVIDLTCIWLFRSLVAIYTNVHCNYERGLGPVLNS